eukprot:g18316.t1
MESKSYKDLQALAKLHGIRANLSKAALINKLASLDKLHQGAQDSSSRVEDNAVIHRADSVDPEGNSGKCGDEVDTPTNDSDTSEGNANQSRLQGADSEPQDAAYDRLDDADVALSGPVESEVPEESSDERRRSGRLPKAKKEAPAPLDPVETEVPVETTERRKSDRLSAAAKKESHTASDASRKTKPETKTKKIIKQPTPGPSRRFERMHQNLFAGQASIETYGKTPKKKTVPAKENAPLSKVTPIRPVGFGSSVKSAKRGLTVASKPCTLVVQRSNKKPTQIKEFRLSSNQSGKREPFKPYSGPVRPLNLANKGATFNVGSSSSASGTGLPQKNKTKRGIKATLASGKAKSARKNAHVQSSKLHRERVVAEARVRRASRARPGTSTATEGSGGRISGANSRDGSGGAFSFVSGSVPKVTLDETVDSEEQDIREEQRRGRWSFGQDHDPVVSAIKSMKDLFPNVRVSVDPTTSLKLRKRIYPLKTVLTLGADYNTQIGVWQFRSTWEDSIIGGRISIAGREVMLTKSWLLKVMDQEDVATRLKFRAAINTRDWTAYAKFGFRTERISPLNIRDGFQLAKKIPLDGLNGHAKLEVVSKLALPEPELQFSTNGDTSKGVVIGMGDVNIGIEEFNLLLEY